MKIVAAATMYQGVVHFMPAPHRHHHILHKMSFPASLECEQGFLTSEGKFVDRVEAKRIAIATGQEMLRQSYSRDLFSEDLW